MPGEVEEHEVPNISSEQKLKQRERLFPAWDSGSNAEAIFCCRNKVILYKVTVNINLIHVIGSNILWPKAENMIQGMENILDGVVTIHDIGGCHFETDTFSFSVLLVCGWASLSELFPSWRFVVITIITPIIVVMVMHLRRTINSAILSYLHLWRLLSYLFFSCLKLVSSFFQLIVTFENWPPGKAVCGYVWIIILISKITKRRGATLVIIVIK